MNMSLRFWSFLTEFDETDWFDFPKRNNIGELLWQELLSCAGNPRDIWKIKGDCVEGDVIVEFNHCGIGQSAKTIGFCLHYCYRPHSNQQEPEGAYGPIPWRYMFVLNPIRTINEVNQCE